MNQQGHEVTPRNALDLSVALVRIGARGPDLTGPNVAGILNFDLGTV